MMGCDILLWAPVDSATIKSAHSLCLRSTAWGLYFLGTCYPVSRWRIEFSVPLLTLLQLQSYLVPCISARTFIIPKLPNIRCKQFPSELSSLCTEHLPNYYSLILLNPASICHALHPTGALGNTFPVLFQLK